MTKNQSVEKECSLKQVMLGVWKNHYLILCALTIMDQGPKSITQYHQITKEKHQGNSAAHWHWQQLLGKEPGSIGNKIIIIKQS